MSPIRRRRSSGLAQHFSRRILPATDDVPFDYHQRQTVSALCFEQLANVSVLSERRWLMRQIESLHPTAARRDYGTGTIANPSCWRFRITVNAASAMVTCFATADSGKPL